jgi:hypothetical protein
MTQIKMLRTSLRGPREIEVALRTQAFDLETDLILASTVESVEDLGNAAASELKAGIDISMVDKNLARGLHKALAPLFAVDAGLLGESRLWEWMAVDPLRQYFLHRWCDGGIWLSDSSAARPKDASLLRAKLIPQSVKSQARHVVMRLFLYGECAIAFDGSYDRLGLITEIDQDVNTAIFERRLGLSSGLAIHLAEAANSISGPGKRRRRRQFFREVNLMLSTVSAEFLLMSPEGAGELTALLDAIAVSVSQE